MVRNVARLTDMRVRMNDRHKGPLGEMYSTLAPFDVVIVIAEPLPYTLQLRRFTLVTECCSAPANQIIVIKNDM